MALVIGIGNLLIGLAYAGLGLLSAWETFSLRRYRGWSRFGIGFALMAASCGPHHLVHGWHALHGGEASWPVLAVTLIGLPAGLIFVGLRFETALGGRGDRPFGSSRYWAVSLIAVFAVLVGWLTGWTLAHPATASPPQLLCTALGLSARAAATGAGFDLACVIVARAEDLFFRVGRHAVPVAQKQPHGRLTVKFSQHRFEIVAAVTV